MINLVNKLVGSYRATHGNTQWVTGAIILCMYSTHFSAWVTGRLRALQHIIAGIVFIAACA
jgi:hypothetical protein